MKNFSTRIIKFNPWSFCSINYCHSIFI